MGFLGTPAAAGTCLLGAGPHAGCPPHGLGTGSSRSHGVCVGGAHCDEVPSVICWPDNLDPGFLGTLL